MKYPKCPRCREGRMVEGFLSGAQCDRACERSSKPACVTYTCTTDLFGVAMLSADTNNPPHMYGPVLLEFENGDMQTVFVTGMFGSLAMVRVTHGDPWVDGEKCWVVEGK